MDRTTVASWMSGAIRLRPIFGLVSCAGFVYEFAMRTLSLLAALLVFPLALTACDKKEDGDKKAEKKEEKKPSLMLSNDTEACRKALECCEEMVKAENGGEATPENINLSCSGVGMAADNKTCGDFAKGYKAAIEAKGGEVPASCN